MKTGIENLPGKWRVHTPCLLKEIMLNDCMSIMFVPMNIFQHLLAEVAERASQLNDRKLDELMMRLTLYEVSDPESPNHNPEIVKEYLYPGEEK